MSLFPRFVSHNHEFAPLFRLLDDFATVSRSGMPSGSGMPSSSSIRAFQPKFDVKELKDSYELHGELPGIEQKDINIEWQDSQTLSISGRTEHRSERREGFVEGEEPQKQIEGQEGHEYHKPTVEEEAGASDANKNTETAMTKSDNTNQEVQRHQDTPRYWVTERSVGEFHRSFSFPSRVDQEAVKASLKNGILSIVVPKANPPKPRKINIE